MTAEGDYSQVADEQLDELEQGSDPELYNAVLMACDLIFTNSTRARGLSTGVRTTEGIVLRLPVVGHPPYKVFWSTAGPRIEAVFPHP